MTREIRTKGIEAKAPVLVLKLLRGTDTMTEPSTMTRRFESAVIAAMVVLFATSAQAESLWQRRDPRTAFLFYDTSARNVGDLLTIVIRETTDVQNRENRNMSKDTASGRMFDFESATGGDLGMSAANSEFQFDGSSNRSFDGSATFRSEQEFTTRVTASIVDVLPNGDLVIAGRRRVFVAGDRRVLAISGVVRAFDVSADNTIESPLISNFMMTYDAEGQEQRYTRRGWLGRTIDKLWPY